MRELRDIDYLQECNGLTEAVYLLEQRLTAGCTDKGTVLRLLFLYWFFLTEPAYLTNNRTNRDWRSCFANLVRIADDRFSGDSDYYWVLGYLLCFFPEEEQLRTEGKALIARAIELAPNDPLPKLALGQVDGKHDPINYPADKIDRLSDWGPVLGDYFRQIFRRDVFDQA